MKTEKDLIHWLDDHQSQFLKMADNIWAHPEIAWLEYYSAQLQADAFADAGFTVWSLAYMPTGFITEW